MFDTANFNVDKSDFTIRKPYIKGWHLIILGAAIALTLFYSSHATNPVVRNLIELLVSVGIVVFLYLIQKYIYDEKTATEFQCLIFSGSMRANTLITLILNRDGSIYYLDSRYVMNFNGAKSSHSMEQFMTIIGLPETQQSLIYAAINAAKSLELVYRNNNQNLKITLYPIARPDGFFSLNLMTS